MRMHKQRFLNTKMFQQEYSYLITVGQKFLKARSIYAKERGKFVKRNFYLIQNSCHNLKTVEM
jgi:hypothetical protein